MAANPCSQPLKSNPFITYRDPITGKWIVENPNLPQAAEQAQLAAAWVVLLILPEKSTIISDLSGADFTNHQCRKRIIWQTRPHKAPNPNVHFFDSIADRVDVDYSLCEGGFI